MSIFDDVKEIGKTVSAEHALDVDKNARFPRESIDALRGKKLMSCLVPTSLGGMGSSFTDVAHMCETLGNYCGSSAMVFAMHQIQVACIVRHGGEKFHNYMKEIVDKQLLLASVTSEVGVGGSMRTSVSSVVADSDKFKLDKDATTVSYGAHADDLLITTRRTAESPASDQVLVLARKKDVTLEPKGVWDTMGMRGTCSPPFMVRATGEAWQVLPVSFADISAQTMVTTSHVWWAALWLGIANNAVARAASAVRGEARKKPGTVPPTATRLAEVSHVLQSMRANVYHMAHEVQDAWEGKNDTLGSVGLAVRIHNLKISSSQLAVDICHKALLICGIQGYRNDSKLSIGRHLRDVHSAALMIGNDRILATNASLLLVHKDE